MTDLDCIYRSLSNLLTFCFLLFLLLLLPDISQHTCSMHKCAEKAGGWGVIRDTLIVPDVNIHTGSTRPRTAPSL